MRLRLVLLSLVLTSPAHAACELQYVADNALFIHASPVCNLDFMDAPPGRIALEMSRQCNLSKSQASSIFLKAANQFDAVLKSKGKTFACEMVSDVGKNVLQSSR